MVDMSVVPNWMQSDGVAIVASSAAAAAASPGIHEETYYFD